MRRAQRVVTVVLAALTCSVLCAAIAVFAAGLGHVTGGDRLTIVEALLGAEALAVTLAVPALGALWALVGRRHPPSGAAVIGIAAAVAGAALLGAAPASHTWTVGCQETASVPRITLPWVSDRGPAAGGRLVYDAAADDGLVCISNAQLPVLRASRTDRRMARCLARAGAVPVRSQSRGSHSDSPDDEDIWRHVRRGGAGLDLLAVEPAGSPQSFTAARRCIT